MEFEKVIKERCSTRKFSDKKVSKENITKILNVGVLAPTAKNLQPERIIVVESEEGLKKIDKVSPCRYNAQTCLIVCADKEIAFSNGDYSSYEMDASIVATHMMLEATNLGIDNIWIRLFDTELTRKEFNLDDNIQPVCIINLGYKTNDCPISQGHNNRKDISEIVRYE